MGGVLTLGFRLFVIVLLCWPAVAFSQDQPLSRLELPFDPTTTDVSGFEVSRDGRALFYTAGEKVVPARVRAARLLVYDVQDLRQPRLAQQLPLGDIRPEVLAVRNDRLFLFYWTETDTPSTRMAIFDVREPEHPEKLSDTAVDGYNLALSGDGTFFSLTQIGTEDVRLGFDATDPRRIVRVDATNRAAEPVGRWGFLDGEIHPRVPGLPGVLDREGDHALTDSMGTLRIWNVSRPYNPVLERTLYEPSLLTFLRARFLPDRDAIVVWTFQEFQLVSSLPRPVGTVEDLRELHRTLLEQFTSEPDKFRQGSSQWEQLAPALAKAGVERLIGGELPGLSSRERIDILADYGYWATNVSALEKVVELDPARTDAWLHLGDAARWSVLHASTYARKLALSETASRAYDAYRERLGKDAWGAADFRALNVASASNGDVCDYVIAFFSARRGAERERDIEADPDTVDITNDGRFVHFTAGLEGSAAIGFIESEDKNLNFFEPDAQGVTLDRVLIVPFKDKTYIVYVVNGGPIEVALANVGTVCRYDRRFTPVLAENKDEALCARFARGEPLSPAPSEPVSIPSQYLRQPLLGEATFSAATTIPANERHPSSKLGSYHAEWSGGRGCSFDGVAFLDGDDLEESPRQSALQELQSELGTCDGAKGFAVQVNGKTLIELDGAERYQQSTPPRALLATVGDHLETICRIEQRMSYSIARPMQ